METCTVETGLLRKKPCGQTSVARCANCEQPLCSKHAIAQLGATGKKTGKFLCADCHAAQREYDETAALPAAVPPAKPAEKPPAPPAASTAKPAPAAPAAKPEADQPAQENSDGSIDFTPGKK